MASIIYIFTRTSFQKHCNLYVPVFFYNPLIQTTETKTFLKEETIS